MIVDIYQLHLYLNRCTGQLALETPEIPIAVTICGYDVISRACGAQS